MLFVFVSVHSATAGMMLAIKMTSSQDILRLIRTAVSPELKAGDVVFFHCNTLHSAGKNLSDAVKFSLVYTYRGASNAPLPGTRSAGKEEVALR